MKQKSRQKWLYNGLLLVIASIVLVACVATPTTPPVIGKQQGIQVVNNPSGTSQVTNVSPTVTDTSTKNGITLNIHAAVQTPQSSKIPVIKVQPTQISQAMVNKIVQNLMQGKQLYDEDPEDTNAYPFSKEDVQQEIILRQAIRWNVSPTDEQTQPSNSDWPKLLGVAPETVTPVPITGQMKTVNESDIGSAKGLRGYFMMAYANLATQYKAHLIVEAANDGLLDSVEFTNHAITDAYTYTALNGNQQPRGMNMSLSQAKMLAQNTLKSIGITDFTLAQEQLGTLVPLTKGGDPDTMNQAYGLWFTRDVNGIPATLDLTESDPFYVASYQYERVFMLINDQGVNEFTWTSPMKVTSTISSDAKILPFAQVMDRFKEQFFAHYALNDAGKNSATFTINRITLGMMRVQVKDASGQYMMIPVWDFYGTASGATSVAASGHTLHSFLTINALDGSTIDRLKGY